MKRIPILIAACFIFLSAAAQGRRMPDNVSLAYDAYFRYCFDNREFSASEGQYLNSETVHLVRLAPTLGLEYRSPDGLRHRLMAGADIVKDMGSGEDFTSELLCWYGLEMRRSGYTFSGRAGIFPRRHSVFGSESAALRGKDMVPSVFASDKARIYDGNMEGLLLQMHSRNGYVEAGLDWMGKYGSMRRERFQVFTYGRFDLSGGFSLGWAASVYHYANAVEYKGVVDNIMVSPFVLWSRRWEDFGYMSKLSWLQGIHQDRIRKTGLELAPGGLLSQRLDWKSLHLLSDTYYGTGQMPYYDGYDAGGFLYGSDLYAGCPFYKIHPSSEDWKEPGFYERAEFFWNPVSSGVADIRLGMVAHFNAEGFCGWQQKLGVVFDLDRLIRKR